MKKLKLGGYSSARCAPAKIRIAGVKLISIWPMPTNIITSTNPIHGSRFTHHDHPSSRRKRTFAEIKKLIGRKQIAGVVKNKSVAELFQCIRGSRGQIHGCTGESHFHEVGAVDSNRGHRGRCIAL